MISSITQWILELIRTHGALSVFIGVIIESVIVPIPSPLIIMGAGAILISPEWNAWKIFAEISRLIVLPGAVASTLGAYIGYGIGYLGGKPAIDHLENYLSFSWKDVEVMESRFKKGKVGLAIFLLRALPIVPLSLISAAVGVLRWPVFPFSFWTFLGSIPRCFVLAYLGFFTRDAYEGLAGSLNRLETVVSALIVFAAFGLILWLRSRMKKTA